MRSTETSDAAAIAALIDALDPVADIDRVVELANAAFDVLDACSHSAETRAARGAIDASLRRGNRARMRAGAEDIVRRFVDDAPAARLLCMRTMTLGGAECARSR
jgi:gamma-glutamyl:cysteine ligase YbdK (ATP-grasp superfamily)